MAIPLSKIQVINLIMNELGRLGVVEASNDNWSQVIDQRLDNDYAFIQEQGQWSFLAKYWINNTPDVYNPAPDKWQSAFTLPIDFLYVYEMRSTLYYQIIQQKICVNGAFVSLYYGSKTSDYSIIPSHVLQVLIYYTASRVAKQLSQNIDLANQLDTLTVFELGRAKHFELMLNPVTGAPYNPFGRGPIN